METKKTKEEYVADFKRVHDAFVKGTEHFFSDDFLEIESRKGKFSLKRVDRKCKK